MMKSPSEPSDPPPPPNVVNYTAIGASDAIGYGSSAVCLPFTPCPEGKGYVQLLEKRLKADGKTVSLLNLGLPGGVLSPEIQGIGNQLGRDVLTNRSSPPMPRS
jgi:lysophospholipase L1-like esterase